MRTKRLMFVLVVAFATLAYASVAAAESGPIRPPHKTTPVTKQVPASAIVPKTVAMLPGANYPWVQPIWTRVDGVLLPVLPHRIQVAFTQPPASTPID